MDDDGDGRRGNALADTKHVSHNNNGSENVLADAKDVSDKNANRDDDTISNTEYPAKGDGDASEKQNKRSYPDTE